MLPRCRAIRSCQEKDEKKIHAPQKANQIFGVKQQRQISHSEEAKVDGRRGILVAFIISRHSSANIIVLEKTELGTMVRVSKKRSNSYLKMYMIPHYLYALLLGRMTDAEKDDVEKYRLEDDDSFVARVVKNTKKSDLKSNVASKKFMNNLTASSVNTSTGDNDNNEVAKNDFDDSQAADASDKTLQHDKLQSLLEASIEQARLCKSFDSPIKKVHVSTPLHRQGVRGDDSTLYQTFGVSDDNAQSSQREADASKSSTLANQSSPVKKKYKVKYDRDEAKFICPVCGTFHIYKRTLVKHCRDKHGEDIEDSDFPTTSPRRTRSVPYRTDPYKPYK